jgi:hypothetical protein
VTGNYNAAWDERNYMNDVDNVHAATLVAHGNNDWNVMTKNAFQWYEALKERGVPHQLYYHTGGHGGSPPTTMLNRWFTRYLWGVQNGVENDPIARIVRPAETCPERARATGADQANVTTVQVDDTSKLQVGWTVVVQFTTASGGLSTTTRTITALDPTHVTFSAAVATGTGQRIVAGQYIYLCSTTFPGAYPEWPDPSMQVATMNLLPGAPGIGQLSFLPAVQAEESMIDNASLSQGTTAELALMNSATSPNRLSFQTPALNRDVRISGTTVVNMRVKFSAARANVSAQLVAYPPAGNPFVVDRGWIDPENRSGDYSLTQPMTPNTYYNLRFDMQGKDYIVPTGWRLGLVLLSSHGNYTVRPAPGLVMTVDLANSNLELPLAGGYFKFAGFGRPLGGSNTPNAGSAVPVKFTLDGYQGPAVLMPGWPKYQRVNCSTGNAIGGLVTAQAAEPLYFDAETGEYVFVWKTPKNLAGSCARLDVRLADGATYPVSFTFPR